MFQFGSCVLISEEGVPSVCKPASLVDVFKLIGVSEDFSSLGKDWRMCAVADNHVIYSPKIGKPNKVATTLAKHLGHPASLCKPDHFGPCVVAVLPTRTQGQVVVNDVDWEILQQKVESQKERLMLRNRELFTNGRHMHLGIKLGNGWI